MIKGQSDNRLNYPGQLSIVLFFIVAVCLFSANRAEAQHFDISKIEQWEAEGDTLMKLEKYAAAIKSFTKIIDATGLADKLGYSALYKRAVCYYYTEGKEDLALRDVSKFIEKLPYVPQSHILRALIYRIQENADGQLEDLNVALDFQPENAGLLKWRSGLLIDKEKFPEAKRDAEIAIQLQDDPEVETYLAFAHFNMNNPDSALMAINKAIDLDYTYSPAYLYAGSFCLQSDEFDLALTYLNLGLRADPDNLAMLFYKGVVLVELKKTDEGCSILNKAFYNGYDDAGVYITQYCYSSSDN
jgi:tetratricopeptide (TPR) repeat protein